MSGHFVPLFLNTQVEKAADKTQIVVNTGHMAQEFNHASQAQAPAKQDATLSRLSHDFSRNKGKTDSSVLRPDIRRSLDSTGPRVLLPAVEPADPGGGLDTSADEAARAQRPNGIRKLRNTLR